MMQKIILLCSFISGLCLAQKVEYAPLVHSAQPYQNKSCPNSRITFIQDADGNKYVVKQYKTRARGKLLTTTLIELVALDIGNALEIPLNKACLIPAGVEFVGKDPHLPATLHTYIPGNSFKGYSGEEYKKVSILQSSRQGLTRNGIYHMSRHKDLARIAALDTFVGNNDRGRHNFYYQPATDSFIGIDMGGSFGRDLCAIATKNLLDIPPDTLSEQEIEGLTIYYQTLKQLIELFPPHRICAQLDAYAHASGLFDPALFTYKDQRPWRKHLSRNKKIIQHSCPHALTLLHTLEHILETYDI